MALDGGRSVLLIVLFALSSAITFGSSAPASESPELPFSLAEGDSIVILGNTFAERMGLFGYFETFLHCRFPDHKLRVRNLGWSADEVDQMVRPLGFPKLVDQLWELEADVIFVCLGMNESFGGSPRVGHFERTLKKFLESQLQEHAFNGRSRPRIVLVSPIAQESLAGDSTEVTERNQHLALYSAAIGRVARQRNLTYVDLFTSSSKWIAEHAESKLTINGIHLSEDGDWAVSRMMAFSLGLLDEMAAPPETSGPLAEPLRRLVYEKNYHFFHWWHPANMSYIHGRRNDKPGAERLPFERDQQSLLIADCDRRIWTAAKPEPAEVWEHRPVDGQPVWFPTPSDHPLPREQREHLPAVETEVPSNSAILSPREQLELFQVPDGYEVNLFASEVQFPIANPMAIQFDARGRLWVANTPTWPHPLPGRQPQDSLVILEDTDRDGVADKHTVFLDKMNLLHGFALAGDRVYVAQAPHLVLARDTNGDDRSDWIRVVLHGFGAEDAEHAMNNFRWGPGGGLFFSQGIFLHTQVETPHGVKRVRDAAVFRYTPRDHRFDVHVSHHFWNPYGNLFGPWGRGIVLDASAGQYYPMDILSANSLYPKRKERADHLSFAPGGSIAAGCEWLNSRHFPADVQGRFLVNHCEGDVGTHWYTLSSEGTLYKAQRHTPSLLMSQDRTFRPVALALGPDGAVYVADFYSEIFENVNFPKRHPGRDHSHGRIWRITCKGRPRLDAAQTLDQPLRELLKLLKSHEHTTRHFARSELQRRQTEAVLVELEQWLSSLDSSNADYEHHLVEALWLRQSLDVLDVDLLKRLLEADHPGARLAATQVLGYWQHQIDNSIELIAERINDPDARVRLHAVLACSFSDAKQAEEIALGVVEHDLDPGLEHALDQVLDYFESLRQRGP